MTDSREEHPWISAAPSGVRLELLVQPRAARTEVVAVIDRRLKIRLKAPPVDGAANRELVTFLAERLGISKSALHIARGRSGRRKTVLIEGLDPSQVEEVLL